MKKINPSDKAKKQPVKMLPPVRLTEGQRKWLEGESERTGHTMAVIIRDLVQAKIGKVAR